MVTVTAGQDTFTYAYNSDAPGLIQTLTGGGITVTKAWEPNRDILDYDRIPLEPLQFPSMITP